MSSAAPGPSLFKQPRAVFAVAFACVVSFMGIGLVDPILPALSSKLNATPSQVSLLFTSYLLVTAVAMLFTGWIAGRIGAKNTLIAGLGLIVVFAALAGLSDTINQIVGFRAGWGLGNAMFIATSLAVIVASATGGFAGAIILYEAALGLGIAAGPLVGGLLGEVSWRGPFFGVAVLMAIALLATVVLVEPLPKPANPPSILDPIKALRHRSLLTMGVTALLYNWGFFTMLGYAPYPMELTEIQLGFVFFAWGLLLAFFSITGAPWLQRRFGTAPSLYGALSTFALLILLIGVFTDVRWVVITCVIASGIVAGINNTLTTQAVMLVAPVERPVASAAYGFVRFIGGGLAPFAAGKMVDHWSMHVPFLVGAVAILAGVAVLTTGHRALARADADMAAAPPHAADEVAGEIADEFGGAPDAIDFEKETTRPR
ncbi:MFS transporter [Actinoplanes rectilineatus]|uniref:MFS transporter n=1 Tax=Actinoplanes rectilineatus TaxID=113571 RepID=UPI0005F2DB89|nr:MFS transporter [Actinoplanes rectilineatus]